MLADKIDDVTYQLGAEILKADIMPYPLTVQDLDPTISVVPQVLDKFLTYRYVFSGYSTYIDRGSSLVNSIGQDIRSAVSKGHLSQPIM